MKRFAHQTPHVPSDDDAETPDPANDWPDKEKHRPDEVREPPRPRTPPIREPNPPDQASPQTGWRAAACRAAGLIHAKAFA